VPLPNALRPTGARTARRVQIEIGLRKKRLNHILLAIPSLSKMSGAKG
jgi:hypothetical protein